MQFKDQGEDIQYQLLKVRSLYSVNIKRMIEKCYVLNEVLQNIE